MPFFGSKCLLTHPGSAEAAVPRIAKQLGADSVWITDDYEVEWYVPPAVVARVWPRIGVAEALFTDDNRARPFYDALREAFPDGAGKSAGKAKVQNARKMVARGDNPDESLGAGGERPLAGHLRRLVARIRRANQLPND